MDVDIARFFIKGIRKWERRLKSLLTENQWTRVTVKKKNTETLRIDLIKMVLETNEFLGKKKNTT